METEIVKSHCLFHKVRMTEVSANLLQGLYGPPNHPLGFGWEFNTEWGEVTVNKDYETNEWDAWFVVCDSDTARTAVENVLDQIHAEE
jgi:hypothetical protein